MDNKNENELIGNAINAINDLLADCRQRGDIESLEAIKLVAETLKESSRYDEEETKEEIIKDADGMPIGVNTGNTNVDNGLNSWLADCKAQADEKYKSSEIYQKIRLHEERSALHKEKMQKMLEESKQRREELHRKWVEERDKERKQTSCVIS